MKFFSNVAGIECTLFQVPNSYIGSTTAGSGSSESTSSRKVSLVFSSFCVGLPSLLSADTGIVNTVKQRVTVSSSERSFANAVLLFLQLLVHHSIITIRVQSTAATAAPVFGASLYPQKLAFSGQRVSIFSLISTAVFARVVEMIISPRTLT